MDSRDVSSILDPRASCRPKASLPPTLAALLIREPRNKWLESAPWDMASPRLHWHLQEHGQWH